MAGQIETYGDRTVRLNPREAPLQNPGIASPDAFGAPIAEGVRRATLGVAEGLDIARQREERDRKLREQEAAKARQTRVIDRDNRLSQAEDEILYGDNGVMFADGEKAAKAADDYNDRYTKAVNEIASTLDDPEDKALFSQAAENRRAASHSRVMSRAGAALRKHEQDTMDAAILRKRTDALTVFQDAVDNGTPDEIAQASAGVSASVDQQVAARHHLERNLRGSSPEAADLLAQKDASDTHSGAIDALVARGKFKEARAYFEQVKPQIVPGKRDLYAHDLAEGATNQEAQNTADAIFKSGYVAKKEDADRMVSQIDNADLRDRVQTKVDREWARRQANLADTRGATYENLSKAVDAGADVEQLLLTDPHAVTLEQADKDRLRLTAARAAERKKPAALSSRYYELRNLAAVSPEVFSRPDLVDLRLEHGSITEDERARLMELQADLTASRRTANAKGAKPARGFMSTEAIANSTLRSIGINPNSEKGEMDPRALAFKTQFDQAVAAVPGGEDSLSSDQLRAIANRLVVEETRKEDRGFLNPMRLVRGDSYDVKVRAFEAPGADKRAFTLSQVPAEYVNEALKMKGKDGKPPSELQIISAYNASIASGK